LQISATDQLVNPSSVLKNIFSTCLILLCGWRLYCSCKPWL